MAPRKSDLVRRSLFGSGNAEEQVENPPRRPSRRRSVSNNATPTSTRDLNQTNAVTVPIATADQRRRVERTAVTVPSDLLMRVKDAVAVLNGWPHQYTMARFVEEALSAQLDRLKAELNGGKEFPITNRKIRTGRPPGT